MFYNTRIAFDLGDINNDGASLVEVDSYITIYFEIVYVSLGGHNVDSEYWVSCGMAYNSDSYIWISQYSYILKELDVSKTHELI